MYHVPLELPNLCQIKVKGEICQFFLSISSSFSQCLQLFTIFAQYIHLFANLRWGQSIIAIDLCTRRSATDASIPCIFIGDENVHSGKNDQKKI